MQTLELTSTLEPYRRLIDSVEWLHNRIDVLFVNPALTDMRAYAALRTIGRRVGFDVEFSPTPAG